MSKADPLIDKAFRHHQKHCSEIGAPVPTYFPGALSSVEEHEGRRYAVLRNIHGKRLAVYEVHPNLTFTAASDAVVGRFAADLYQAPEAR